eukprot:TRINITY_DN10917_c4_g1_i1.p1 TRINITY_DN10917_c4_g1~~TRINITY_DN10917_c4_g1_i1.p1  ORF type:complete len:299 (+),score=49.70 TRINITY_DN10917_c4_g1_i1:48-944(+)
MPPHGTAVLKFAISEVVPRCDHPRHDSFIKSVVDAFCKIEPVCPSPEEVVHILRKFPLCKKASISAFNNWLFKLKEGLVEMGYTLRNTLRDEDSQMILGVMKMDGKNANHLYRARSMSFVLHNLGIDYNQNRLSYLLPTVNDGKLDNSTWSVVHGTWIVRMYYLRSTGYLIDSNICKEVYETIKSWESFCGIPSQLITLDYETLTLLLPDLTTETVDSWKARTSYRAMSVFSEFPMKSISETLREHCFYSLSVSQCHSSRSSDTRSNSSDSRSLTATFTSVFEDDYDSDDEPPQLLNE